MRIAAPFITACLIATVVSAQSGGSRAASPTNPAALCPASRSSCGPSPGASLDNVHRAFASMRLRYFGARPLVENNSERSKPTSLVNAQLGYQVRKSWRVTGDLFNLFDAQDSGIDCFFTSRLRGEPAAGVDDIHDHPAVPRTIRMALVVAF